MLLFLHFFKFLCLLYSRLCASVTSSKAFSSLHTPSSFSTTDFGFPLKQPQLTNPFHTPQMLEKTTLKAWKITKEEHLGVSAVSFMVLFTQFFFLRVRTALLFRLGTARNSLENPEVFLQIKIVRFGIKHLTYAPHWPRTSSDVCAFSPI